jgi:lipoprotein signal peptidase
MPSVPPPSQPAAPAPPAAKRTAPLQEAAQTAATTTLLASTVSFAVHAFGVPHVMHTGKAVGPGLIYLVMTVGWALMRRRRMTGLSRWALAVLVGGGLANIAEALLTGGVTDFLPLNLGATTVTFSAGDLAVLVASVASAIALIQRRAAAAYTPG